MPIHPRDFDATARPAVAHPKPSVAAPTVTGQSPWLGRPIPTPGQRSSRSHKEKLALAGGIVLLVVLALLIWLLLSSHASSFVKEKARYSLDEIRMAGKLAAMETMLH